MKIAVTSSGTDLNAAVDPRFGRAAYILIVDADTLAYEVLDNKDNINAFKGAGIQAASMVCEKGATVLLTGYCGPNAFKALSAAEIKVVQNATGTVKEALSQFKAGKLTVADAPNAEGYEM
ncbi:MAG: NifB/NifX family molybdenum-iron cluster-binding protein [Desulfobacterales bacterium]|jgi:predicted Fe-Mo cluster-binding NifX family protein|nr:NifB/NifX family molybdenum-iron cluster-binding protein [Desulfobacterales bacterium]